MNDVLVFDASAILALLYQEPGHEVVSKYLNTHSGLSAVNLAEIIGKTQPTGLAPNQLLSYLQLLGVQIFDLNQDLAIQIGIMRMSAKPYGLSLGDLACMALGKQLACPVITADRAWKETDYGVEIILIRP
ncbi:type II toxin-antitoxin system VapC family toxin [Paenibacillus alkaliterrae]|uniref:type II toxin-antitoxin system VapC family toxin n=1 Tax=Paenibacillus alkaliterrae TaxID=320909 RepID=UPI001F15830E|nr:type II toxin-antitoxin system VapC family toxin [Paenibacillus alkaliterrae]MCF2941911.1 type II toxin-antitoxin system VapC family toxin [Paenibacillus alkaliterrae]